MRNPLRVLLFCLFIVPPLLILTGTWAELAYMKFLSPREYTYRYEGTWKCPLSKKNCYWVNDKNDIFYGKEIALTKIQEKFLKQEKN